MAMSELKQRLYKLELAKIGFPNAEHVGGKMVLQPGNNRLPDINDAGDIRYGTEHSHLAINKVGPIVNRVNELVAAWENSRPAPFDNVANYNILAEYKDIVLAARDDGEYGRGLYFVTWKYDEKRTDLHSGHYTDDYSSAKESFALRSGLMPAEKFITMEQAADIKAAIDFHYENSSDLDLTERLTKINARLCHAYPEILETKELPEQATPEAIKVEKPAKKPSLQEKLDSAKEKARESSAQKLSDGINAAKKSNIEVD